MLMQRKKKIISGVLTLAMVSSLLLAVPVSASCDTNDRPATNEMGLDSSDEAGLISASENQEPALDAAAELASEAVSFQEEAAEILAEDTIVEADLDIAPDDSTLNAEEPELTESLEKTECPIPFGSRADDWSEDLAADVGNASHASGEMPGAIIRDSNGAAAENTDSPDDGAIDTSPEHLQLNDALPGDAGKAMGEAVDAEGSLVKSPTLGANVPEEEVLGAEEEKPLPNGAEEAVEFSGLDLELDSAAERMRTIDYAFAPEGYQLLCVANILEENQVYYYDDQPMYYTEADAYQVGDSDGVFYTLIPIADDPNEHLSIVEGRRSSLSGDMDINGDDVVNIADANALYQMLQDPTYYDVATLDLAARLKADVDMNCVCSIADLDDVVDIINRA